MCSASSRIFVHDKVYDAFIEGLTQAAKAAKTGSAFDLSRTAGPVVSQTQFDVSAFHFATKI